MSKKKSKLRKRGIKLISCHILRGVTALTTAVSGQSQNCSENLEISPGIGTLGNFSGKHAIIPGHCRKNLRIYVGNSKNFREGDPKIREDDPDFRDDLR